MKSKEQFFFYLSFAYVILILALGVWWLYLLLNFAEGIDSPEIHLQSLKSISKMVFWEGTAFIFLLVLLTLSLFGLYLSIQKKNNALKSFLASMTHELKTPLASIRLQAEVLQQLIQNQEKKVNDVTVRLLEDTQKFENHMDKILQLSRVEGGGNLSKRSVNFKKFLETSLEKWNFSTKINIQSSEDCFILIDDFALDLILRNLVENTKEHSPTNESFISWHTDGNFIVIEYRDESQFSGDKAKLGKLFYKHKSPGGSGIGLYLCQRLIMLMGGSFDITHTPELLFTIKLPLAKKGASDE